MQEASTGAHLRLLKAILPFVMTVTACAAAAERPLLRKVDPIVPPIVRQMSVEGTVRLQVTVTPGGHVAHITPLGGNPILMEAARAAVVHWIYAPSPKATELEVSLVFHATP